MIRLIKNIFISLMLDYENVIDSEIFDYECAIDWLMIRL